MKEEIVADECLEASLLNKEFIKDYDILATEVNVKEKIKNYLKLQCRYPNIAPPKITTSYGAVFSSCSFRDKLGEYVANLLDDEKELVDTAEKIKNLFNIFCSEEKIYFTEFLLHSQSERKVLDIIGVSRDGLLPIKKSCILKVGLAFGIEVEK